MSRIEWKSPYYAGQSVWYIQAKKLHLPCKLCLGKGTVSGDWTWTCPECQGWRQLRQVSRADVYPGVLNGQFFATHIGAQLGIVASDGSIVYIDQMHIFESRAKALEYLGNLYPSGERL